MATRPVFFVNTDKPYFQEELISFQFSPGFSLAQKQKNIHSIHDSFIAKHQNARLLEISSKSDSVLGAQLSAFNLPVSIDGIRTTVEAAFQSSKVFERGGPYTDLLLQPPYAAKKDSRLLGSGPLSGFRFGDLQFPLEPKTFFYDWLYITAVIQNRELSEPLCYFNAFTDIEFNPAKSINCQARSAAIYVSITKMGKLNEALMSPKQFAEVIYGVNQAAENKQLSLF